LSERAKSTARPSGGAAGDTSRALPRVLVVTNDFPPRVGGVQQYVWNLVRHLPPDRVAVVAPNWQGWREHDDRQPNPVHRWPPSFLWPTADLARRVRSLVREHDADVVLFGHGFPLPVLGPGLTRNGVPYVVLTHGAEVWLGHMPGVKAAMRRSWAKARAVVAISDYTARAIRAVVPPAVPLSILNPAVDAERFNPSVDGSAVRERYRLGDRPVVLCVSRLVPRKGQDVLIRGLALVRALVPGTTLVLAGAGPYRPALERIATEVAEGAVHFAGQVPDERLPDYYAACDVFAMPCRSRWGGLEVEGFGIVFLEASASGKPVVAGRSGGAHEAVADLETGLLVEGGEPKAVALALVRLLGDQALSSRIGASGRARMEASFTWGRQSERLARILSDAAG
jgi:phosphatidylinositol alpha-1,6-mannosyltransferase